MTIGTPQTTVHNEYQAAAFESTTHEISTLTPTPIESTTEKPTTLETGISESTTLESATAESTTLEATLKSKTLEIMTSESTNLETMTPESTTLETTIPKSTSLKVTTSESTTTEVAGEVDSEGNLCQAPNDEDVWWYWQWDTYDSFICSLDPYEHSLLVGISLNENDNAQLDRQFCRQHQGVVSNSVSK